MKNRPYPDAKPSSLKRRKLLALALTLLCGISLALVESYIFGNTQSAEPTSEELATASREAQAAMPRLPVNIEDQLASAQYPQLVRYAQGTDPFVDKAGVARTSSSGIPFSGGTGGIVRSPGQPLQPAAPQAPDLNSRVEEWRRNYRAALAQNQPLPAKTRIYLLSELTPIGKFKVSQNTNAPADVWFRLDIERRTFSAPIGTRFYDAELIGLSPEGPTFRMANGSIRTVKYAQKDVLMTTREKSSNDAGSENQKTERPESQTPSNNSTQLQQTSVAPAVSKITPAKTNDQDSSISAAPTLATLTPRGLSTVTPTLRIPVTSSLPLYDENISGDPKPSDKYLAASYNFDRQFQRSFSHGRRVYGAREKPRSASQSAQPTLGSVVQPQPTPEPIPQQASSAPAALLKEGSEIAKEKSKETGSNNTQPPAASTEPKPETTADKTTVAAVSPTPVAPMQQQQKQSPVQPQKLSPLCDPHYRPGQIDVDLTSPTSLGEIINKFNTEFGANIILDNDAKGIEVQLTITGVPWTQFLRIIMDLNDLGQVCSDGVVGIAKRSKLAQMDEQRRKQEPVVQEIFHLRYLQPVAGGRTNLAGQSQGGPSATIQSLEDAIRAILRASGDPRADVRRVPGRNELLVAGTRDQIEKVRELIRRVDRPGYQVLIRALVYTANENQIIDIGSQIAAVVGNPLQTNLGGFTSLPNVTTQGNGNGTGNGNGNGQTGQAGLNPGGVPGLGAGMRQPSSGLAATNAPATFGFTTLIGTAQFSYQLTLAQQRGVVNIQSRPFGIVTDGDTFDLVAGTQIPVVTSAIAGGAQLPTGNVQFIEASRIARITPQVADTEDGTPAFVTLNIQLENNAVDTSLGLFNGVPGVNRQSLQTVLRLRDGETAVIGGLSADSVSNAISKVPGLGDIPVLGNLFRRKTNQENRDRLYFAITVQVIPQESPIVNVPTPADAITNQPPPPRAQKPSPFKK